MDLQSEKNGGNPYRHPNRKVANPLRFLTDPDPLNQKNKDATGKKK